MQLPRFISAYALGLAVGTLASAQINGSFEADPPGSPPSGWVVTGGTCLVQNAPDCLFPSHGSKYLSLDANGTGPGTPTYGPHAAGTCAQVKQIVLRPSGQFCSLSVDWEYLPVEALPSPFNDWFSIDVVDANTNALIRNVVYIDSGLGGGGAPFTNVPGAASGLLTYVPNQSALFGSSGNQAPAGFKRAVTDLSFVPVGTPMRIEISCGNAVDYIASPRAYVDRVKLSGGQQNFHNFNNASLRVLGSSHFDGLFGYDWADDVLSIAPYTLRVCPGQRLSFRSRGQVGSKWAMVAANLLDPGLDTVYGQINVDVFFGTPYTFVINGFAADPVSAWMGTMTNGTNWIDAQIPATVPLGSSITVQGGVEQGPGGPIAVTAATTIEVGAPQIPIGGALIPGGANYDDGSTLQGFAGFGPGNWPFYGIAKPNINVNSNGNLTFGAGDGDYTESETEMLAGSPRIAPEWDDFLPGPVGEVKSTLTNTTYTVSWTAMEEFNNSFHGNNFSVQLYQANGSTPAGVFTIYYGSTTMDDGLTGISPGGLPAPPAGTNISNVNWSSLGASLCSRGTVPAGTHKFERFAAADNGLLRDTCDLMTIGGVSRITFVPDGAGGYTYFVGTR